MTIPHEGITYKPRWYFGGVASAGAVLVTQPLDLIKVLLQTQHEKKLSMMQITKHTVKTNGILSLYNGMSASILRQLTYTTARFAIYEAGKPYFNTDMFLGKIALAGISGAIGGFIGTPTDVVNVRMQNDVKLPKAERRNYKNVFDGLYKVARAEGIVGLFAAASPVVIRAGLMTIGQIAVYDQVKVMLLRTSYFKDDFTTHLTTSLAAATVATLLTQPLDVLKTVKMNAKPGEFSSTWAVVLHTAKQGPLGFFSGFLPAFMRVGPHTMLLFVFFEQLRLNFGIPVKKQIRENEK